MIQDINRDNIGALLDFGHALESDERIAPGLKTTSPRKSIEQIGEALFDFKIKQFRAGLKKTF